MARDRIPDIVIGRLPLYLRALRRLKQEQQQITSSQELANWLGISSAQIRKDLSHFGEFGKQGTGYNVALLVSELERILKVTKDWDVVLVGIGDLGRAIAHYRGFYHRGFKIAQIYDNDPEKVGQRIGDLTVFDVGLIPEYVKRDNIRVAMLATPLDAAQKTADLLVKAGVKAILNYAPIVLNVPAGVNVQYIDPVVHLQRMTYYIED